MKLRLIPLSRHSERAAEENFRLIVRQYQEPLYHHLRRFTATHEDAQDALQETFIRAYKHISELNDPQALKSWLYRIATHEALRLAEQRPTADLDIDPPAEDTPDYETLEQALEQALLTLPPSQRAVFTMRHYEDMSYEDIAQTMDSNVKAVTANYHLAKERIKEILLQL